MNRLHATTTKVPRRRPQASRKEATRTNRVEPRIVDFSHCGAVDYQAELAAINQGRRLCNAKLPTVFSQGEDGKLKYHTRPVPAWRMRRARRILWECWQRPDWRYRPSTFFRHPALATVPYPVLKQLVKESEPDG